MNSRIQSALSRDARNAKDAMNLHGYEEEMFLEVPFLKLRT